MTVELPYAEDRGQTHYEGCWAARGHHNCAVREVERLREAVGETTLSGEQRLRQVERAVWEWQLCGSMHPLTCGTKQKHEHMDLAEVLTNPTHDILRPDIRDGAVVLVCPTCDYVQEWIPEIVTGPYSPDSAVFSPPNQTQQAGGR